MVRVVYHRAKSEENIAPAVEAHAFLALEYRAGLSHLIASATIAINGKVRAVTTQAIAISPARLIRFRCWITADALRSFIAKVLATFVTR
jgi:hypothetical protein